MKPGAQGAGLVLYLDFDGVLHGEDVRLDLRNRPFLKGPGVLFEFADYLAQVLAPYPSLDIVLSTSWVRVKSYRYARKRLPTTLQRRVIGATWHSEMVHDYEQNLWWMEVASRYDQIASDVRRRRPVQWLALDDDAQGWPENARAHLIQCDPVLGLGDPYTRLQLEARLAATTKAQD